MRAAALTIVAKNYLPFARQLMASVREHSPEMARIVVLVDRPDGYFDPQAEDFQIILSEDLGIPRSRWFHFKYTILELSTAVKPYAIENIFDRGEVDRLFYFDPDIAICGGLPELLSSLDDQTIVLTPHLTAPVDDERRPGDLDILRCGAYNLGFIGVRKCEESARFLKWWQTKLYEHCVVDLAKGLFVDQRWIDLAPGMFSGARILRDPGLNVAYWNIAHRRVTRSESGYMVNGSPLCFFHFSGFDPENPGAFSRHQDRFTLDDLGDAKELALNYRRRLFDHGYSKCKTWPYAFGVFENGFPIPDIGRPAHQEAPELASRFCDPFSEEGYWAFLELWNAQLTGPDGKSSGVTRLAYRIYKAREDVQASMPDIFKGDLRRFMNWVLSSGASEHNLSDVFVAPIRNSVQELNRARRAEGNEDPVVNEKIIQTLAQSGTWVTGDTPVQVGDLNQLVGNGNGAAKFHLSKLAKAIYQSRPDLQRFFPDPCGHDGLHFLEWFLTHGAQEYRLAEVLLAPLRTQWNVGVESLGNPFRKLWHRFVYAATVKSLVLRSRRRGIAGAIAMVRMAAAIKPSHARNRHHMNGNMPHSAAPIDVPAAASGVNIVGYVRSETGVGESVRCAIRAARLGGLKVAVKSVDVAGPYRLNDVSIKEDGECPHGVNLFHVNADQSETVIGGLGGAFVEGRYNIGCWNWELEEFPDRWASAFQRFDEIWTLSAFCQTAIARKSPVPVVRMPPAIRVDSSAPADRAALGIPEGHFVFLSIFDLLSISERKNPIGAVRAFRLAFGHSSQCTLVLKINHAQQRPLEMERILEAASGLPVVIIDRTIDRSDVTGLLQMSDCLVSLHRSEGFGLTIAEAMYLGKPVVVTGYSGNLDFTKPDNSFLVEYDLVGAPEGCHPYDEGSLWAAPRLDHAASQMRLAAGNAGLRRARANSGRDYIHRHFAPEVVGRMMAERLDLIPVKANRANRRLAVGA